MLVCWTNNLPFFPFFVSFVWTVCLPSPFTGSLLDFLKGDAGKLLRLPQLVDMAAQVWTSWLLLSKKNICTKSLREKMCDVTSGDVMRGWSGTRVSEVGPCGTKLVRGRVLGAWSQVYVDGRGFHWSWFYTRPWICSYAPVVVVVVYILLHWSLLITFCLVDCRWNGICGKDELRAQRPSSRQHPGWGQPGV